MDFVKQDHSHEVVHLLTQFYTTASQFTNSVLQDRSVCRGVTIITARKGKANSCGFFPWLTASFWNMYCMWYFFLVRKHSLGNIQNTKLRYLFLIKSVPIRNSKNFISDLQIVKLSSAKSPPLVVDYLKMAKFCSLLLPIMGRQMDPKIPYEWVLS